MNGDDRLNEFRTLYDSLYSDLWRYCLRRCPTTELAEEALSETFTVAWQKFDELPPQPERRPWLFGVARNHIRRSWRNRERDTRLAERLLTRVGSSIGGDPADHVADASEQIVEALLTLDEPDQELLRLVAWEELSHREIALILDCTPNAVAIRLHRTRDRLATALAVTNTPNQRNDR